ncbi:hypothetical protein [Acetobacterium bakii]|uniref:Uncharacterized protein n=1 Tax=Acetobacterium bakii TaxID=52689 RepID=A0A0L6TYS2_9FIRM|nr:hypothetical protein [Acetobacterium bakii]KNZ41388.1 hypothetical protein AKG39_12265 [Acetobacterium bakii]
MKKFINSVRLSIENKNWYSAIFIALSMPDICGKLARPNLGSQARYIEWFDSYLLELNSSIFNGDMAIFLTGRDCYALRCSILHEGTDDITTQRVRETLEKIQFTTLGLHRVKIDNILTLNVACFCEEMCEAVENWYNDIKSDEVITGRIESMLEIKIKGFNPIPGVFFGEEFKEYTVPVT